MKYVGLILVVCAVVIIATVLRNKSRFYSTKVMLVEAKGTVKLTDLGGGVKVSFLDTGDEFFTTEVTPYMRKVLGQAGYVKSVFPIYYVYFLHNGKTYVQYILGTLEGYDLHAIVTLFGILNCFSKNEFESYLEDSLMKRTDGSNLFLGKEKEVKCKGTSKKQINSFVRKMKSGVVYSFQ